MNIIDESFKTKKVDNTKKIARIVLTSIIILFILTVILVFALIYMEKSKLRVYLNGQLSETIKKMLVIEEDGTIYVPIREIASSLQYSSYRGDYTNRSEDINKCYIESKNEATTFTLNSDKIYKINLQENSDYEYYYIDKKIKAIDGNLYITSTGLEKAFNVSFDYNQEKNTIQIYTMSYLISHYNKKILDYGYTESSKDFVDQKAVFENMLIVTDESNKYGVIDLSTGEELLELKYDSITYIPTSKDFLVQYNKKIGILSKTSETKIDILYDSIELMDSDSNLYVVRKDNKYGVIDIKGKTKIYIEYDQIGIDISDFSNNNIKSKYLLADNLIPVKKDNLWGFFNKSGKQVVDFKYDQIGYIASNNKEAINLLLIPEYNVIVVGKNKKYTLLNSAGEQLYPIRFDDIYMTVTSGTTNYYMIYNDEKIDAREELDKIGISTNSNSSSKSSNTNTDENTTQTNNITSDDTSSNKNSSKNGSTLTQQMQEDEDNEEQDEKDTDNEE